MVTYLHNHYSTCTNLFLFLFLLFLQIPKPVILFLDGHSSHLGLEASKYCRDHQIILYCFMPNVTHILQPFDVRIFSPLKDSWAAAVYILLVSVSGNLSISVSWSVFVSVNLRVYFRVVDWHAHVTEFPVRVTVLRVVSVEKK